MSGGHFQYKQYEIGEMKAEIEYLIEDNPYDFSKQVLDKFKMAVELLKVSEIYVHRIDWLVSGDDGEETFLERLKNDLWNDSISN